MKKKSYRIIILLMFALFVVGLPAAKVYAAASMSLYNYGTKKNMNYTGQQVQYNYNGTSINMKNSPGIIMNGVALASYQDAFVNASLKLKAKYTASSNTLALSKGSTSIVFTVGSKKAKVNGKAVTLSAAPMKVKYKNQSAAKILVPTRFVTEAFGYLYSWNSASSVATIIPPRNLYYNSKKVAYTGTDGQVSIDGKSLNLGTMPSIIIDNTAMVMAKKVFNESSIGAEYVYDKPNGKVTLKKDANTVELTLGKATAYVNGKARVMDTAPLVVKNLDTGKSYIMVPGSFVASCLGYDYYWNASTKTSEITTRKQSDPAGGGSGQNSGNDPELGSDPLPEMDTVAFSWDMQNSYTEDYNKAYSAASNSEIKNTANSKAYVYDVSMESQDASKEVYSIHSNTSFGNSTVSVKDKVLTVHLDNAETTNSSYNFGGKFVGMITSANDASKSTSDINFELKSTNFKYEYRLSADGYTLYITLYPNYLTNVTAGTKDGNDYLILHSLEKLQVNLTDNGNYLMLQIPTTINAVGENYADTSFLTYLKSVQCIGYGDDTINIIVNKPVGTKYRVTQDGNTYAITMPGEIKTGGSGIQIKLPEGVSFSDVTDEDRYYDLEFSVLLPGDYRDFFSKNPIATSNNTVKGVNVTFNGSQTEIIVSTARIQGYKLNDNNGSIDITVGDPKDIYKKIVVLDAGHGGTDPGAMYSLDGTKYNEKDINYAIMYERTQKYFNASGSDIKAYYSRYDDYKVPLEDRAAFASEVGADFFVSLHMNANGKTTVKGTDVYYSDLNNAPSDTGLTSKKLASIILNFLPGEIGTNKRNVLLGTNLVVLKKNTVPAVLIELGFMSNKSDLSLMVDETFQEDTAKAIYDAVSLVFDSYPTGR